MDAIRWQGNSLALLDQTRLPVEEVWNTYTDYRKVADAIRRLVVRGAPAIGVAAAYALCLAAMEYKGQNPEEFQKSMPRRSWPPAAPPPSICSGPWTGWAWPWGRRGAARRPCPS